MNVLDSLKEGLKNVFGDHNTRKISELEERVKNINELGPEIAELSDEELASKTDEFKERLEAGETLDDILYEAFAVVREVADRLLGERHYDVQLMGGMVMHEGAISEMKTGEGKTLASTAPIYLNALSGNPVHVVTVNDYLARRDAVWMGQIYKFLGMNVGVINNQKSFMYAPEQDRNLKEDDERRDDEGYYDIVEELVRECPRPEAYAADITYGTNNQFGFDYLRDHLSYDEESLRQRGHTFAIIDEIDSILIDEARTPLIISAPAEESEKLYATFSDIARKLKPGEEVEEGTNTGDYVIDEEKKAVMLTDAGIEKAEKSLGVDNIYTDAGVKYVHHLETAIKAKSLYEKDQEYVVRDGEVQIVDEFTGRILEGRRFSEGLHQAIEAKEGVTVQKESKTYASITFQNYFRLYDKLAGMTGTAMTSSEEFFKVYDIDTFEVPTNKPIARDDMEDQVYQTEIGKFEAVARKVKELNEKGQPTLIGTVSIEKNELLSDYLKQKGVAHEVLNAKNDKREGEIVAEAGAKGAVTIATNVAGRGVDIKLGGAGASKDAKQEIKDLGGLFVLGTERHNARRIDDQLRGRAGRQGDPGASQFFVSLEDELMRIFASDAVKRMMGSFGIPEDQPIENRMITNALERAQRKIEGFNFDARRQVLQYDDVLDTQRKAVYTKRDRILHADTDGMKKVLLDIADDDKQFKQVVEKKLSELDEEQFLNTAQKISLQAVDMLWVEHLDTMDETKNSSRLRSYGKEDPVVVYKQEGKRLFENLMDNIDEQIRKLVPNIGEGEFKRERAKLQASKQKVEQAEKKGGGGGEKKPQPATSDTPTHPDGTEIGRNDMVVISKSGEKKEMKYKKAKRLIDNEDWTFEGSAREE
jgi:preprotein translocase subunit SecA